MMNFTTEEIDTLKEIINIGVGEASGTLNEILSTHINLQIPYVKILNIDMMKKELQLRLGKEKLSTVELEFFGTLKGYAKLVFPTDSAIKLISIVSDEEMEMPQSELDELKVGALTEIGNIVISGVMGSMSNLLNQSLDYFVPSYIEGDVDTIININCLEKDNFLLLAQTSFLVKKTRIKGDIILIFNLCCFPTMLKAMKLLEAG